MTSGLSLVALAIAAATATFVLIIHELHIRALNMRVSKAVMGVPGQSAPFQDMTGWLSSLGMRYRRFYSAENLEQLRTILQSSGFNHHRTMPILIGVKTVSMFLFPIIALFVAQFFGKSLTDLLIFTAHWRGDRNYGAAIDSVGAQTAFQCCHSARHAGYHRFAGCVQRSGNGPGERAGTSSGRNEPV